MSDASQTHWMVPTTPTELAVCLSDPMWRICSGQMYRIMIKAGDDAQGSVIPFIPNLSQRRLLKRLWHRNIILKARQLGFTTLVAILWLDHALFNADQRCGIIAQDREAAEAIFRDKVKLAYDRLPDPIKAVLPLARDSAAELLFSNNSSIRVATSMRSGTIHRLHISEFGKICAKFPDKAAEVVTGSLPAVPDDGIAIIESTAEGRDGEYYKMTQRAIGMADAKTLLTIMDYRFHFFAWWQDPAYRLESTHVVMTDRDREYFAVVEAACSTTLAPAQRNWYVAKRDSMFSGDEQKMWQEYPSTPAEAFQVSTDGNYFAKQVAAVRRTQRLVRVPVLEIPVNTFWDIGNGDGCAIWCHQQVGAEDRFVNYHEAHGESLMYYVKWLSDTGYLFNKHFLPHDAAHKRLSDTNNSTEEMLNELGLVNTVIVPIITDLNTGIQMARKHFASSVFDEEGTKLGFSRLENYKKKWNRADGRWGDEPDKANGCSEGADAYRQFAQAKEGQLISLAGRTYQSARRAPPDWRS